MNIETFLTKLTKNPTEIDFSDTMAVIEHNYVFTPSAFTNGEVINAADQNNGSCKIFAFAMLNKLSEEETLQCFGDYYRQDVLLHPTNDDHQNIRHFMKTGWSAIKFSNSPLSTK